MNPLNFLQHLFTHRAIEHELSEAKVQIKELQEQNHTLQTELHNRDAKIEQLHQEIKNLNDFIHAQSIEVDSDFDPRKI